MQKSHLILGLSLALSLLPAVAQPDDPAANTVKLRRRASYSIPARPAKADPPKVVIDTVDKSPLHFRTSTQLAAAHKGNVAGLETLRCSGSAAFSIEQMHGMLDELFGNVMVVDLRQEPHAYIQGRPFTWEAENDWYSVGLNPKQALEAEDRLYWQLRQQLRVEGEIANPVTKAGQDPTFKSATIPVRNMQTEEEVVRDLGLAYQRFFVIDHLRPDDATVDQFVHFVDRLPAETWLHFHCRGGKGRTTTFMTMYDMMKNAPKVPFSEIIARQAALDPNYDVTAVRPDSPRSKYYQERLAFLEAFYSFCAEKNRSGQSIRWSVWTKAQ